MYAAASVPPPGYSLETEVEGIEGLADGSGFSYTRLDENHRPSKVYLHRVGTPTSQDRLVFEEPDPGFFVSVGGTRDGRFVFISVGDHETSEYRIIPAGAAAIAGMWADAREAGE